MWWGGGGGRGLTPSGQACFQAWGGRVKQAKGIRAF